MAKKVKRKHRFKLMPTDLVAEKFSDEFLKSKRSEAKNKQTPQISSQFHEIKADQQNQNMLYCYDIDLIKPAEAQKILVDLKMGAKVALFSSFGQATAKRCLLDLGIDDEYASQVFVVCNNGQRILHSNGEKLVDTQNPVKNVKKDASNKEGFFDLVLDKGKYLFDPERNAKLEIFAKSVDATVEWDGVLGCVSISGCDRISQIVYAKRLLDALVLSDQEKKNFGINFVEDKIVIRPKSQSIVNAEFNICAMANIPYQNVRRSVYNIGQINNNSSLEEFFALFVDESGKVVSAEQAQKLGFTQTIYQKLFKPEQSFVCYDKNTHNGSWIENWTLENKDFLKELFLLEQNSLMQNVVGAEKLCATQLANKFFDIMQPMYDDQKLLSKSVSYTEKELALKKKFDEEVGKTLSNFDMQSLWQNEIVFDVIMFMLTTKDQNNSIFTRKFENNTNVSNKELVLKFIDATNKFFDCFEKLEQQKPVYSLLFSGFFIEMHSRITKSLISQQQLVEKYQDFVEDQTKKMTINTKPVVQQKPVETQIENQNKMLEQQQILDKIVLSHSVLAFKQMVGTILTQNQKQDLKTSFAFVYFSKQLQTQQNLLNTMQDIEGELEGINVKNLEKSIDYAIRNLCIEHYNQIAEIESLKNGTQFEKMTLYDVPESLQQSLEYKTCVAIMFDVAKNVEMDVFLPPKIHNTLLKSRDAIISKYAEFLKDFDNKLLFKSSVLRLVVQNAFSKKDELLVDIFSRQEQKPKEEEAPQPQQPEPETKPQLEELPVFSFDMVDAFKQFLYVPSITLEQTDRNFYHKVLNMTNIDLWMFNRYHNIITTNMIDTLSNHSYTDKTMLSILDQLNKAFEVQEGMKQSEVTAYKAQGKLKDFEQKYNIICEEYKSNLYALKQAKEVFLFEVDIAKRLDIYRHSISETPKGFSFMGKKAQTQDELLDSALKQDLKKDAGKVLAMIQSTSLNLREYNLFKFDVQTTFEATASQFESGVLKCSIQDFYKYSRAFVFEVLLRLQRYLERNSLDNNKQFEIFFKLKEEWKIDSTKRCPEKAFERDAELASFSRAYKKIVKAYKEFPIELKKAQDMFMFCVGEAKAIGEMFKQDNPASTWAVLSKADKIDYVLRFVDVLNDDFDILVQIVDTAALIASVNEAKNMASKIPFDKELGQTSVFARPTGQKALVEKPKTKTRTKKLVVSKPTVKKEQKSQPKPQPKEPPKQPTAQIVAPSMDELREQLVVLTCINNLFEIEKQITKAYQNNPRLAQNDPVFAKIEANIDELKQKNQSFFKNTNVDNKQLVVSLKDDQKVKDMVATVIVVNQMAFNKLVEMGIDAKEFEDDLIPEEQQKIAQNLWTQIIKKSKAKIKLTFEEEVIFKNAVMWQILTHYLGN